MFELSKTLSMIIPEKKKCKIIFFFLNLFKIKRSPWHLTINNVIIKEAFPFNVYLLYTLIYLYASSFDGIYISIYITYNVFAMGLFFSDVWEKCVCLDLKRKSVVYGFEKRYFTTD